MKEYKVILIFLLILILIYAIYHSNNERFTLLKNIPEVKEKSLEFPTLSVREDFTPPIKSYGTLLKNIPIVKDVSKKFATSRSGRFKGIDMSSIPNNFDGRIVWKEYLTPVYSQGSCGNCWAHATTSALADRFAIMSLGKIKFMPSPYEITICSHKFTDITKQWNNKSELELMDDYLHGKKVDPSNKLQSAACEGASLFTAAEVLYTDGVPSLECFPQKGSVDRTYYNVPSVPSEDPSALPYCHTLETMDFDTCVDQKTAAKKYRAKTAYNVGNPDRDTPQELEHSIMYEIYKRGPIPSGFMVFPDFMEEYDGTTVYTHPNKSGVSDGGHAIKIVGWGDDGVDSLGNKSIPYWIIQNSWGGNWGDKGFFKIKRGIVDCQLEQNAMGMIPDFPGMEIIDPNIIPIETTTDIEGIKKFPGHYLDPYTGYYLSGIEKIKSCKLTGNVVPYIDPTIALPKYADFYAGKIKEYLVNNPVKDTPPIESSVKCDANYKDVIPPTVIPPTVIPPTVIPPLGSNFINSYKYIIISVVIITILFIIGFVVIRSNYKSDIPSYNPYNTHYIPSPPSPVYAPPYQFTPPISPILLPISPITYTPLSSTSSSLDISSLQI